MNETVNACFYQQKLNFDLAIKSTRGVVLPQRCQVHHVTHKCNVPGTNQATDLCQIQSQPTKVKKYLKTANVCYWCTGDASVNILQSYSNK